MKLAFYSPLGWLEMPWNDISDTSSQPSTFAWQSGQALEKQDATRRENSSLSAFGKFHFSCETKSQCRKVQGSHHLCVSWMAAHIYPPTHHPPPMLCSLPTADMWSSHSTLRCTSRPWADIPTFGSFWVQSESHFQLMSTLPQTWLPTKKNNMSRVRTLWPDGD